MLVLTSTSFQVHGVKDERINEEWKQRLMQCAIWGLNSPGSFDLYTELASYGVAATKDWGNALQVLATLRTNGFECEKWEEEEYKDHFVVKRAYLIHYKDGSVGEEEMTRHQMYAKMPHVKDIVEKFIESQK
ncbi:hypothetical protein D1872_81780 [compost metagenome]